MSLIFHHFAYNANWLREIKISYTSHHKEKLKEFARYRNFCQIGLSLPLFSSKLLFELIDAGNIMKLLSHILLERNILLIRTEYKDNAIYIESLLQLIAPLYFFLTILKKPMDF